MKREFRVELRRSTDYAQAFLNGDQIHNTKLVSNHTSGADAFNWGYMGSGPAQLSANILVRFFLRAGLSRAQVKEIVTPRLYQNFKEDFIAPMPFVGGVITLDQILYWFEVRYPNLLCVVEKSEYFAEACKDLFGEDEV